ncbi:hypothetical protein MOW08_10750 [Acinetobacter schindleri]|nr:hypothetical protein MOW08_10750 [Acinetobacter schindleri]
MLNNNKNMIIDITLIFLSSLALMLLLIKDEDNIAKAEHSSLDEQPVLIQQGSQLPDLTLMLENEQKIAQQNQQIIQKRDDLYMQLADISNHLSQGRKPDLREVSRILEMQRQLVKVKVISVQEATATIQFLQKVLPEMGVNWLVKSS